MKKIISINNPKSPISEAYRGIRTSIEFTSLDKKIKTITVTSAANTNYKEASATYTLTNKAAELKITTQPTNVTVAEGETAKTTIAVSGVGLTYKWYFKNASSTKFTLTDSFTSNSYSVEMNNTRAGRQIYCVITDAYGQSVTTNTVTLTNSSLGDKVTASAYTGDYDGSAHGITVTSSLSGATITYATTSTGTYSSTNPTYTDAGTYTIYYKVEKAGYTTVSGSKTVTINKVKISTVPSQSGTLTYTGSAQSPSWNNYDSTKLTLGGVTSKTDAGTYTATFTPTTNYTWSDGTTTAKSVNWTIGKKAGSVVLSATSGEVTYPTEATFTVKTNTSGGTLSVTSTNEDIATVSISDSTITITPLAKEGTATITVTSAANTN